MIVSNIYSAISKPLYQTYRKVYKIFNFNNFEMNETRLKKSWYKRWWAITLFIFIGLVIISGIFGDNTSNTEGQVTSSADRGIKTTQQEAKIYSVGDSIQAGDFTWKITKSSTSKTIGSNPYLTTEASGVYVILDVEVENTGKSAKYLTDSYLKLIDDQGREFSPDTGAAFYLDSNQALMFEQVNPGITKKGKIVFDVPEGLNVVNIRISSNLVSSSFYNVKLAI
jgi:hypothetical protein